MKMTVLIPTYRRPQDLLRCLQALNQQDRLPDEVLIVVRDSDHATHTALAPLLLGEHDAATATTYPLQVVSVTLPGQVAALNAGITAATGDIISITDDDAVPHPHWLAKIEQHFLADAGVGGVGGRDWLYFGEALQAGERDRVGRLRWFGARVGNHHLGVGAARAVEVLKGANMSYRRTAIAPLKFDERLRGQGAQVHNDLAFSLAVKKAGWTLIYDPEVSIDHLAAPRFDEDQRHQFNATAFSNAVHNETVALLTYLSWPQRLAFALWALVAGNRQAFGVIQLLRFLPSEGQQAWQKWQLSMAGRWQGGVTWAQSAQRSAVPSATTARPNSQFDPGLN